jgi:hypothetical protein
VANSVVTVLPITTAPAARAQATAAASARGRCPAQIGEPYSLGMSAVSSTSFTPIGSPASAPGRAGAARTAAASKWLNARTTPSRAAMRSRHASSSAADDSRPASMRRRASVAVRSAGSVMARSSCCPDPANPRAAGPAPPLAAGTPPLLPPALAPPFPPVHPAPMTIPAPIQVAATADGTLTYLVALPPEDLPAVRARDLDAAWHRARAAAIGAQWGALRLFRFRRADGSHTDLALADPDAACWAAAADTVAPLAGAYGLSLCLRLLALVALMARTPWARPWFTLRRDGADIAPALLAAAAQAPLTREALFDPDALRAKLARGALTGAQA